MNKKIKLLIVLLMIQLGLIFLISYYYFLNSEVKVASKGAFIEINWDELDQIIIKQSGQNIDLIKQKDDWKIKSFYDYPVLSSKISEVFSELKELSKTTPVGKTLIAAKQFEVDENDYERKIEFYRQGNKLADLYLGASPSYKKVYARLGGEELTYAIEFGSHQLGLKPDDWMDRKITHQNESEVLSITTPNFVLINEDGKFVLDHLPPDSDNNFEEIEKTVAKLLRMPFEEVLGIAESKDFQLEKSVYNFQVTTTNNKTIAYNFTRYSPDEKNSYVLKMTHYPFYFKVDKNRVNDLLTKPIDDLIHSTQP